MVIVALFVIVKKKKREIIQMSTKRGEIVKEITVEWIQWNFMQTFQKMCTDH